MYIDSAKPKYATLATRSASACLAKGLLTCMHTSLDPGYAASAPMLAVAAVGFCNFRTNLLPDLVHKSAMIGVASFAAVVFVCVVLAF